MAFGSRLKKAFGKVTSPLKKLNPKNMGGGPDRGQVSEDDLFGARDRLRNVFGDDSGLAARAFGDTEQRAARRVATQGAGNLTTAARSYRDVLSGDAESLAEMAVKDAANRAAQTSMGVASSGRGNQALAQRAAVNQAAMGQADAARQAGSIALQEQMAARQGLSAIGAQQYSSGNQARLANADRQLAFNRDVRDTGIGLASGNQQFSNERRKQNLGLAGSAFNAAGGLMGGIMSMTSDKREKKDISSGEDIAREVLDSLEPKRYAYKDSAHNQHDEKEHLGIMAQDLEKTAAGAKYVSEAEDGVKKVDYGALQPAMLASLATLNEDIKKLKKGKG